MDDTSAEAHTSAAIVKLDYEWDREGAQRELRRALELNPGSGYIRHWFAHSLEAQRRLNEAMNEMRDALALDPLSLIVYWDYRKRTDHSPALGGGTAASGKSQLFPHFPLIAIERAEVYYQMGNREAAHQVFEDLKAAHPEAANDPGLLSFAGAMAAREGRREESRQKLQQLEQLRTKQYVEPFYAMYLAGALTDREGVMRWLRRAYEERSTMFLYLPLATWIYGNDRRAGPMWQR